MADQTTWDGKNWVLAVESSKDGDDLVIRDGDEKPSEGVDVWPIVICYKKAVVETVREVILQTVGKEAVISRMMFPPERLDSRWVELDKLIGRILELAS